MEVLLRLVLSILSFIIAAVAVGLILTCLIEHHPKVLSFFLSFFF